MPYYPWWRPWDYPGATSGQMPWYYGTGYLLYQGEPLIRSISLVTDATTEPVTLEEAKQHERIDTDADDDLVTAFITVARKMAEEYTGRAFNTQTWNLQLDYAPSWFDIPRPPLQSVTEIVVTADDGTETVESTSLYSVDTISTPGRIFLNLGSVWDYYRSVAGFRVEYEAGYGDDGSDVPYPIREAILQIIGHLYENRESQAMPDLAKKILDPYKVFYL